MPKTSSTSGFRLFSSAVLWALIVILISEAVLARTLPQRYFSHEVDQILYDLEHKKYNAEFLLLGDSVGGQIWRAAIKDDGRQHMFAVLPSNAAIEMTGQYYLVQRYLKRNKKPKAVIFLGRNFLSRDLNQVYTENFVQRCFLNFREIAEITSHKGVEFGLVMLVYKCLPSYRYRLHLQKRLAGFANSNVGTGLLPTQDPVIPKIPAGTRTASKIYLIKLLALCDRLDIHFYLIEAPMPESTAGRSWDVPSFGDMRSSWDDLEKRYGRLHLVKDMSVFQENDFAADRIHLNPRAVMRAGVLWWKIFDGILRSVVSPASGVYAVGGDKKQP